MAPSAFGTSSFGSSNQPSAFGSASSSSLFGNSTGFGGGGGGAAAPGAFQQGGSILQTGFAPSTTNAPAGGFGGPPAFGQPSFGGAATFGSPKASFGAFGATASPPSAFNTQVTQKNSLFESLGTQESAGLSFGNIAQSSQPAQQNPSFTGGYVTLF